MSRVLFLAAAITTSSAFFHPEFTAFLEKKFNGKQGASYLVRAELGEDGSFGGMSRPVPGNRDQSVILVHGGQQTAGTYREIADYLESHGHLKGSVYATTYGTGADMDLEKIVLDCQYLIHLRALLLAVAEYTHTKVDVIAYSMGAPVARKAILGGKCAEVDMDMGGPLTDLVDTFVSVAGINHGHMLCAYPAFTACNLLNGLGCYSKTIREINGKSRYEGAFIYSIYSNIDDELFRYNGCGAEVAPIEGANGNLQRTFFEHEGVMLNTLELQNSLITKHEE